MKLITALFIAFLWIGCSQEEKKSKVTKKPTYTKPTNRPNNCQIDSITIIEFDSLINGKYRNKDSYSVLDSNLIHELKPFLVDSVENKYSCCPEQLFGEMIIYSKGEEYINYLIVTDGKIAEEYDTTVTFIYTRGYQFRGRIPNYIWRKTLKDLKENRK